VSTRIRIARESRQAAAAAAAAETKKNSKNSSLKRHAYNSCCALVYFNFRAHCE